MHEIIAFRGGVCRYCKCWQSIFNSCQRFESVTFSLRKILQNNRLFITPSFGVKKRHTMGNIPWGR